MSTSDGSTAANILTAALCHMRERASTYDKPEGERSMGATVGAFLAVTGVSMTEEQGWLFMALLKAVRSQQGAYRADSYEDGAAYFALAGEAAVRDRTVKESLTVHPVHPATFDHIDQADVEIANAGSFAEKLEQFVSDADDRLNTEYHRIVVEQQKALQVDMDEFLRTIPVEPASAIDDDSERMQAIGQNGEMASEVYAAVDGHTGCANPHSLTTGHK